MSKKVSEPKTVMPYETIDCVQCGQRFMIQKSFWDSVVMRGRPFYCPAGHSLENKEAAEKLRKERAEAREREQAEKKALEAQVSKSIWDKILPWRVG